MNSKTALLAAVLAAAPFAASAGGVEYTYVEAGYVHLDVEDGNDDGFQLRGSVALAENVYLHGGYASIETDDFNVELEESQIGVGLRSDLGERADFIAELGYVRYDLSVDDVFGLSGSDHIDGGRLSVGLRGLLADRVEGWAKASYNDGGDFDGSFSALIGAQVRFNQTWGVFGEIESGELLEDIDTTKYMVGVRASF
jgi:Ax21 family sulfation-dependent quorum factor